MYIYIFMYDLNYNKYKILITKYKLLKLKKIYEICNPNSLLFSIELIIFYILD